MDNLHVDINNKMSIFSMCRICRKWPKKIYGFPNETIENWSYKNTQKFIKGYDWNDRKQAWNRIYIVENTIPQGNIPILLIWGIENPSSKHCILFIYFSSEIDMQRKFFLIIFMFELHWENSRLVI